MPVERVWLVPRRKSLTFRGGSQKFLQQIKVVKVQQVQVDDVVREIGLAIRQDRLPERFRAEDVRCACPGGTIAPTIASSRKTALATREAMRYISRGTPTTHTVFWSDVIEILCES